MRVFFWATPIKEEDPHLPLGAAERAPPLPRRREREQVGPIANGSKSPSGWNRASSPAEAEASSQAPACAPASVEEGKRELEIVRHPRARTLRLSLDPTTGRARLTLPRRAALGPALAWAEGKAGWLAAQRAALPRPRPFVPGAVLPVADEALTLRWSPGKRLALRRESDALTAEGPTETLARRTEAWLRREALAVLSRDTAAIAERAGVTVSRVTVGDAKGRWGSCASTGVIRYSWRLILAPGFVRHATVAHEVAHRVHMHHGPAFHALAADLLGDDPAPARVWLRQHGAALHWFGRSS